MRADVSTVAGIDELFEFTMAQFGRIDIVVANAGVEIIRQPVLDATEAGIHCLFGLNTKGAFFTLQRAGRLVADGGRILRIGSSSPYVTESRARPRRLEQDGPALTWSRHSPKRSGRGT